MNQPDKVSIRPQVTMLSVLKYLEYEMWFAIAEFVDNAIESYQKCSEELKKIDGHSYKLIINIEFSEEQNKITIRDNAGGIGNKDYSRAFRAAEIPPDNSGLSEFGMGMKSAACWFSDNWRVTSTAIGETIEKRVHFNMEKIISGKIEELDVESTGCGKDTHYTIIELFGVNRMPRGRNVSKVKNHLKSIYREFIRTGNIIIKVDGEKLTYLEPKILEAPSYNDPQGPNILWRKEIDFPIEEGLSVKGFIAIREKGSTAEAGFALFRRGRVVEGSYDNGFRPLTIFGAPNSYRYQRVFGELHLEGFDVAFTKKGIQWDENLDIFLDLLKDEISSKEFPLLQQAEEFRVRASEKEYKTASKALEQTVEDLEKKAPKAIEDTQNHPASLEENNSKLSITDKKIQKEFTAKFNRTDWQISIELSYDPAVKDLIEVGNHLINTSATSNDVRQIGIRLSLTHPFMVQFAGIDNSRIEPILKFAAALGLSEVIAKESGAKMQGEIRRNFNELITKISE